MPLLQGLIFDLDGTLLDSAPDLRQAVNQTLRAHGRSEISLEDVTAMVGDGMLPLLHKAFAATGKALPDSESYKVFQQFIEHYRSQKADPSQIYPHTVDTLKAFQSADIKLGICTNKQEAATHRLLKELGLDDYFSYVAGGDTFPVHKPNPDHVKGVLEKLGVAAENCAMVGDGPNDVRAAHGAGIPCIVITHGYGVDFENLGARALIPNFMELVPTLKALGFEMPL